MAYFDQARKSKIAPVIKSICARYNMKCSISVRNHSTLVIKLSEGRLDLIGNYNRVVQSRHGEPRAWVAEKYLDVNPYHFSSHFDGECLCFLTELFDAANDGNHDNSDLQTDYFDVGWYVDVDAGNWNKPYLFTGIGRDARDFDIMVGLHAYSLSNAALPDWHQTLAFVGVA